ncbi:phosphatase PAP2 family protein [Agromyces sp. SYSU K20354]|uniref:phosphatase PAP2 family protein n=1 Tax=Agromyces cavernae TaxID=2898659 RepID=UPI001E613CD1|nr:phosphatase PAP2 family protein [Agromyces cavernae]MCD2442943.1 phosphatase PAP2 family protein [Agromyces cavernae]
MAERDDRAAWYRRHEWRMPLAIGSAALVAAVLLGAAITFGQAGIVLAVDEWWAAVMLGVRGPVGDTTSYFMNFIGGGRFAVFAVPVTTAVVLLIVRRPWAAGYFIVGSAASAGVVQLLKNTFDRGRPEDMIVASDFGSFPSGHAANAATIAVVFGVLFPHVWVWVLGAVYAVLMALSRTYLGAHWLSDTVGGMLVGAGVALVLWAAFARPLESERLARLERVSDRSESRAQAKVSPPEQGSGRL